MSVYRQLSRFKQHIFYLPEFLGFHLPTDEQQLTEYYHQLLAMQYHLYLYFLKGFSKRLALVFLTLFDPVSFAMAKHQHERSKKMK